jgi:glutamine synthetase
MSLCALSEALDGFDLTPQGKKLVAEYVWPGEHGEFRSKSRTLNLPEITHINQLPLWDFDGSSTHQAAFRDSEISLKPCAFFNDPFRRGNNVLVLCECYVASSSSRLTPLPTNTRYQAAQIMEQVQAAKPWYAFLQQYMLMSAEVRERHPFGWPSSGFPRPQGPYYCGVGAENAFGRRVCEAHYRACLYAGVTIGSANSSQAPGQWEYAIGPCGGMRGGDVLCISRYILKRVCEDFGVEVSFDPKPVPGAWSGSGCLTTFSTSKMRDKGGFEEN